MTTNPSPTTQRYAAGPHQDWPRLSEDAERYLDSPTAGTLPADIPGGRHPILDALELHPVNGTRATGPVRSPTASKCSTLPRAASGELNVSSGAKKACGQRPSATWVAEMQTPPTERSVRDALATPRPLLLPTTPPRNRRRRSEPDQDLLRKPRFHSPQPSWQRCGHSVPERDLGDDAEAG